MESGLLRNIGQRFSPGNSCLEPIISGWTQVYISRAPMLCIQFRSNNSINLFTFVSHSIYTWLSQPGLLKRQNKGHWAKYKNIKNSLANLWTNILDNGYYLTSLRELVLLLDSPLSEHSIHSVNFSCFILLESGFIDNSADKYHKPPLLIPLPHLFLEIPSKIPPVLHIWPNQRFHLLRVWLETFVQPQQLTSTVW